MPGLENGKIEGSVGGRSLVLGVSKLTVGWLDSGSRSVVCRKRC